MTIQNIIQQLDQQQFFTSAEKSDVTSAATPAAFMQKIAAIFESRVEEYISTCTTEITETCQIEQIPLPLLDYILDEVMRAAYRVFFELNEVSSVVSIKELLRSSQKELLTSLALTPTAPDKSNIRALAKQSFIGHVSRYRMFKMINTDDLKALCQEDTQNLFPEYLLSAFQIEETISQVIKSAKAQTPKAQHDPLQKAIVAANKQHLEDAARGILFYLQNLISTASIDQQLKTRHFSHLQTAETRLQFAHLVSCGYTQALLSDDPKTYFVDDSKETCTAAKIYQICTPALSYIGLTFDVDDSVFDKQIAALQLSLDANRQSPEAIAQQYEAEKANAHAAIKAWRQNLPQRPFTIGFQVNNIRL